MEMKTVFVFILVILGMVPLSNETICSGNFTLMKVFGNPFSLPREVAYTNQNLYVMDSDRKLVMNMSTNGTIQGVFGYNGQSKLVDPRGMAVDMNGSIYVLDRAQSIIQKFDSVGNFLFQFGSFG